MIASAKIIIISTLEYKAELYLFLLKNFMSNQLKVNINFRYQWERKKIVLTSEKNNRQEIKEYYCLFL